MLLQPFLFSNRKESSYRKKRIHQFKYLYLKFDPDKNYKSR
ncbi:hypothetical protein LSS_17610 [Leptospira santarosai serovar Shermani str. LT 821]|uniref:Uncharacterized protein n=1 Tax=Leptospira santarosai serovar Shermani str. LT 821 TaxID=758847 RepID=K8Y6P2_9LEPT|nr:hypothetical protein LSS_17610 [Leptospira santarosai serovar Shermani str. LT 821]